MTPVAPLPAGFARLAGMALIIVATTATAAGTSTAAARSSTTAGSPTAGPSAGTSIGLGTSLVNIQSAAADLFPVQRRYGFFGFAGIGHFYECESSGTPSVTIRDYADLVNFAMGFKQGPQFRFGGAVREIANKKLLHGFPFSVSQRGTSDFVGGFG
jgi:hypothetical protein